MPRYYDGWEAVTFDCKRCGWSGLGEQCEQGEMFRQLFALVCPKCALRLTVITYPTIEESHANWDKVSPEDKLIIEMIERKPSVPNLAK
jgi:hypothetical protein